jgi:hypothetical protein
LILLLIFGQDCNSQRSWICNLYGFAVERLAVLFLILEVLAFMTRKSATVGPWLTNSIRSRGLVVTQVGRKSRLFSL